MKKLFFTAMLASLTISMLTLKFNVQPVIASGTIYIRADGSVEGTTQISTADNITYMFTGNIYDSIVVERDNITLDGQSYLLQGSGSGWGITLSGRSNVTLRNIEINMFNDGIRLTNSSDNTVSGNTITYAMDYGVLIISSSNNNTVSGNNIAESYDGIVLASSSDNTISGNTITTSYLEGVTIKSSSNNTISDNNITNSSISIYLYDSSRSNNISGNNITNSIKGISIVDSPNNKLRNNTICDNTYNFGVLGHAILDYIQDIDDSNTVDRKPVYYLVNRRDIAVPIDAGYVALANCTRMSLKNSNLTNNEQGVLLAFTTNSTISGNNITKCWLGFFIHACSGNTIFGNNIVTNYFSGLYLWDSSNNTIYHNNFINFMQVFLSNSANNIWDNGCEGNYWIDYAGSDSDGDGIGDTPYMMDGSNQDYYPLMNPYWNPSDINHDRFVDIFDVVLAAGAYDSTPSDPEWNPHCDIAEAYEIIDIFDIVTIAMSYGKEYVP